MTCRTETTLAVMQPTFLPWLGYFALIASADTFVFLDDVQFSKQSWQSRNRIAGPNREILLSVPVARKPSKPLISEARIANPDFGAAMLLRIEGALGKAPFWPLVRTLLERGFERADDGLAALNIGLIEEISGCLGLTTCFLRSCALDFDRSSRSNRLSALCAAIQAERYLSPVGAAGYLAEDRPFDTGPTALWFQNFTHPTYDQGRSEFRPYMSAIDALAWVGPERTRALILQGIGPHFTEGQLQERSDEP